MAEKGGEYMAEPPVGGSLSVISGELAPHVPTGRLGQRLN
jgi:hypothetical protein